MKDVNRVELSGEIFTDIELKSTENGRKYCNFSLLINNDIENDPEVVPLLAMGETAAIIAKKVRKGQQLILTNGQLCVGSYVQNSEKRFTTEVIVNEFKIV